MTRHITQRGFLEAIVGCMMSGKTTELIRRVETADIAGLDCHLFKPTLDDRYDDEHIVGHSGREWTATAVETPASITDHVAFDSTDIVAIDEVQFFDQEELIDVVTTLVRRDITVIAAGLDLDFRGEPFPATTQLLAHAEYVDKLHAICTTCGNPATRSQRLIDGEPAPADSDRILVGGTDHYEPRCRSHHVVE